MLARKSQRFQVNFTLFQRNEITVECATKPHGMHVHIGYDNGESGIEFACADEVGNDFRRHEMGADGDVRIEFLNIAFQRAGAEAIQHQPHPVGAPWLVAGSVDPAEQGGGLDDQLIVEARIEIAKELIRVDERIDVPDLLYVRLLAKHLLQSLCGADVAGAGTGGEDEDALHTSSGSLEVLASEGKTNCPGGLLTKQNRCRSPRHFMAQPDVRPFFMQPLLQCRSLKKSFRLGGEALTILHEIDLEFHPNTWTTIQGASGSGKSTLLQILGGLESPDSGTILWNDQSIYGWPRNRLAQWRNQSVGFVFQAYHLLPELTALQNVELPARLGRRPDSAKSTALLEQVGLAHRMNHRPAQLSGGEQQRVAIARALRNDPALLLADEPTGNLDQNTGSEIIALLRDLTTKRQLCVVLVTHDDQIAQLGNQKLHLRLGKLVA